MISALTIVWTVLPDDRMDCITGTGGGAPGGGVAPGGGNDGGGSVGGGGAPGGCGDGGDA